MSQFDFGEIDATTKSGAQLASDLNDFRDALHSTHKGSAAPSYAVTGLYWIDDTGDPLWIKKVYDGTDWIPVEAIDSTSNVSYPISINPRQSFPTSGGTANALTLTPAVAMIAYSDGDVITFTAATDNTAAATLNVSGVGAKSIRKIADGADVAIGVSDILGAWCYTAVYKSSADSGAGGWILVDAAKSLAAKVVFGQCRLTLDSGNLKLMPFNGNLLTDGNGKVLTVPSAGITRSAATHTVGALYYVYAYDSDGDGVLDTLDTTPTGHVTANNGVETKSGAADRVLVGMARPVTGPAWADTTSQRFVRSWFNRPRQYGIAAFTADRTTSSTSLVELNSEIRNEFLTWADDAIQANFSGWGSQASSGSGSVRVTMDGPSGTSMARAGVTSTGGTGVLSCSGAYTATEGYHYVTMCGQVTAGTLTVYGTGLVVGALSTVVF